MPRTRKIQYTHLALIALIPLIGFGVMYALVYILPISDKILNQLLFTLTLIAVGLAVPYWILKAMMHQAHLRDHKEKELKLMDLPKDKDQLEEEAKRRKAG